MLCSLKLFPPRCYDWVRSMLIVFSSFYRSRCRSRPYQPGSFFLVLFLVYFVALFSFSSVDHHFRPFGWFFNFFLLVFLCSFFVSLFFFVLFVFVLFLFFLFFFVLFGLVCFFWGWGVCLVIGYRLASCPFLSSVMPPSRAISTKKDHFTTNYGHKPGRVHSKILANLGFYWKT